MLATSCYMGKKIDQPLVIHVDKSALSTEAVCHVAGAQYLDNTGIDAYTARFIQALLDEAGLQANIRLTDTASEADHVLRLDHFMIAESATTQTVSDERSPYNGQSYMLAHISGRCEFTLIQGAEILGEHAADVHKEEKLKNGQSVVQLVAGWNKDHTEYRQKLLPDDVCYTVAETCGRRTWNLFTQKLAKKLK